MSKLSDFRAEKDQFYRTSPESPLEPEQQRVFSGLKYYPENEALRIQTRPVVNDAPELVDMQTSTGDAVQYLRWGTGTFPVEGKEVTLTVFRDPSSNAFFLPFQDAGRGTETYGAGRYVEAELDGDGRMTIDFNYAYNPYCAYNDAWSCPLPPPENRLAVHIRAGEMVFHPEL